MAQPEEPMDLDQLTMDEFAAVTLGDTSQKVLQGRDGKLVDIEALDVSEKVKTLLKESDTDGDGHADEENLMNVLKVMNCMKELFGQNGRMSTAQLNDGLDLLRELMEEKANNSQEMAYKHLPECIQHVMEEWDENGDGHVCVVELSAAAKAYKKVKAEGRLMKRIILVLFGVILILLAGMFVMSYMAVDMAKEMRGNADGVMQNADGEVVKVASSAFDVQDGTLVTRGEVTPTCPAGSSCRRLQRKAGVLEVAQSQPGRQLSSTVPDEYIRTLDHVTLKDGAKFLQLKVQSMKRVRMRSCNCGSVVELETKEGLLTLDDYELSADSKLAKFLSKAGMPDVLGEDGLFGGRKLKRRGRLEGFFSKLADVELGCEKSPLASPKDLPQGYYAKLQVTQSVAPDDEIFSQLVPETLLPGIVEEEGKYFKTWSEEVLQTPGFTVKAKDYEMHPLQTEISVTSGRAQASMELADGVAYQCTLGMPKGLEVSGLLRQASQMSLVGFLNEDGRVLRQWRLQVANLPSDSLTQMLGEEGDLEEILVDYIDIDTDPTEIFQSGQPYRIHIFSAPGSGSTTSVTFQYEEISELDRLDLSAALQRVGVERLAEPCEGDVFATRKTWRAPLLRQLNVLALAEDVVKVPSMSPWMERRGVVSWNQRRLKAMVAEGRRLQGNGNKRLQKLRSKRGRNRFWEKLMAMKELPEEEQEMEKDEEEYVLKFRRSPVGVKVRYTGGRLLQGRGGGGRMPRGRKSVSVTVDDEEANLQGELSITDDERRGGRAKKCMRSSWSKTWGGLRGGSFKMGTQLCLVEDYDDVRLTRFDFPEDGEEDDVEVTTGQLTAMSISPQVARACGRVRCRKSDCSCCQRKAECWEEELTNAGTPPTPALAEGVLEECLATCGWSRYQR